MCSHCFEEYIGRSKKIMLLCDLKSDSNELVNLCSCQRFCNEKDKYIPYYQKENCKYYED